MNHPPHRPPTSVHTGTSPLPRLDRPDKWTGGHFPYRRKLALIEPWTHRLENWTENEYLDLQNCKLTRKGFETFGGKKKEPCCEGVWGGRNIWSRKRWRGAVTIYALYNIVKNKKKCIGENMSTTVFFLFIAQVVELSEKFVICKGRCI